MTLLLSLFLLLSQADGLPTAKMSAFEFSAVKQHTIGDQSCIPSAHRQITFPTIEYGTHFALLTIAVGKPLEIAKYFPIFTEYPQGLMS